MNPVGIVLAMPWVLLSGQEIPVLSSENYYGEEKAAKLSNPEIKLISKGRKHGLKSCEKYFHFRTSVSASGFCTDKLRKFSSCSTSGGWRWT